MAAASNALPTLLAVADRAGQHAARGGASTSQLAARAAGFCERAGIAACARAATPLDPLLV